MFTRLDRYSKMLAKLSDLYKRMDEEEERAAGPHGLAASAAITNSTSGGLGVATGGGEGGGGGGLSRSRSYLLAKRMAAGAKFLIDRGTLSSTLTASNASTQAKGAAKGAGNGTAASAMALEHGGQGEQRGASGVGDKRSRSSDIDPRLATPDELKVSHIGGFRTYSK